jgi:hypothetical protein
MSETAAKAAREKDTMIYFNITNERKGFGKS